MKKLLKKPEAFLVAAGLVFLGALIILSQLSLLPHTSNTDSFSAENAVTSEYLVNINTATKSELMQIDGIGEVLADRIIAYRTKHGGFGSVGELTNITGIGEATLASITPYITTE